VDDLKRSAKRVSEHGVTTDTSPTVAELIEFLQQFNGETEVWAAWEGQIKGIGRFELDGNRLFLDVD
jgi:hypothetical protein